MPGIVFTERTAGGIQHRRHVAVEQIQRPVPAEPRVGVDEPRSEGPAVEAWRQLREYSAQAGFDAQIARFELKHGDPHGLAPLESEHVARGKEPCEAHIVAPAVIREQSGEVIAARGAAAASVCTEQDSESGAAGSPVDSDGRTLARRLVCRSFIVARGARTRTVQDGAHGAKRPRDGGQFNKVGRLLIE